MISDVSPVASPQGESALASHAGPGVAHSAVGPGRSPLRRLLTVVAALIVLRATQAAIAVITVLAAAVLRLEQPSPHLCVARLGEVELQPLTPLNALVMVAVCAVATAALVRRRPPAMLFAGMEAFALLVASTIGGVVAVGSVSVRLAVVGCGAGLAVTLWPAVRRAALAALVAVGLPHPAGRLADVALAAKIVLLAALVTVGP